MKRFTLKDLKDSGFKEVEKGVFKKVGKSSSKPPAKEKKVYPRNPRTNTVSNQAWHEIGGKRSYYRSLWEYRYALYLQWQKERGEILEWEHEPDTFWFEEIRRGVRSYLPDFKVWTLTGEVEYAEVKGWMDPKSATKIKRMGKYYPNIKIRVVDESWFKDNQMLASILWGK